MDLSLAISSDHAVPTRRDPVYPAIKGFNLQHAVQCELSSWYIKPFMEQGSHGGFHI